MAGGFAKRDGFRDLYDRLAFEVLEVPLLRQRTGDVELLAHHILHQFALEIPAFKSKILSTATIDILKRHDFPGNVRELKNIIERAAYRGRSDEIVPEDIGILETGAMTATAGDYQQTVSAFCKKLLADAMQQASGNQARAARLLGLSYHQLRYYYKKYLR